MSKFNFSFDQLCTVWYRADFEIEADTQEEANKNAIKLYEEKKKEVVWSSEWSPVETTLSKVSVKDDGLSTEEIFTEDCDVIFMNGKYIN